MKLENNTKIKYEILDKDTGDKSWITLSIEQIEGSVPNFYKQVKKALNLKNIEITNREIVEE